MPTCRLRPQITPSGRKVFLVQYRYPPDAQGRVRRYTIGPYGESLTPDQARGIAVQVKGKLAAGIDPVSNVRAVLADAPKRPRRRSARHANSVGGRCDSLHRAPCQARLRSWREYERMLQDYVLPDWGRRSPRSAALT
jgi:hypothetical protein